MLHITCSVAEMWGGGLRPQQRVQESGKRSWEQLLIAQYRDIRWHEDNVKKVIILVKKNTSIECFYRVSVLLLNNRGRES